MYWKFSRILAALSIQWVDLIGNIIKAEWSELLVPLFKLPSVLVIRINIKFELFVRTFRCSTQCRPFSETFCLSVASIAFKIYVNYVLLRSVSGQNLFNKVIDA